MLSTLGVSLLGALALVSVGLFVFLCRRFFARGAKSASVGAAGGDTGPAGQGAGAGQSKALNDLVEWVFGQPRQGDEEWTNVLARALTQQAAKNKSPEDFKLRVEKISNFENPPQFSRLSSHRSPLHNSLVVRAEVLWKRFELSLSLTPGPTSHGALYSVVSRVIVFEFQSPVEGVLRSSSDNVTVLTAKFPTEPKMKLEVKHDHEVNIDSAKLERLVRKTISETEFRFPFSAQSSFGSLSSAAQTERFESQNKNRATASAADELLGTLPDRKRKLLVRIIKASGLVTSQERDYGSHQHFCVAIMDNPVQRYMTSSVKNTANPFFDELFALDVDQNTKKLTFEVHDKDRPEDDDFLGMAVLTADDFSRNRHVLPLTGRGPMTFGSLTVEVSIVDSDQVPSILATSHNVQHIATPESPIVLVSEPEESSILPTPDIPTETLRDPPAGDAGSKTLPVGYLPPKGDAKKKSLVGAIKKRFGRKKANNPRSQSADRAQEEKKGSWSSSSQASHYGGEGVYLTPTPSRASAMNLESDDQRSETSERRSRSNSLRKSLSGFFRSGRSPGVGDSPSTPLPYGHHQRRFDHSPEGSVVGVGGGPPSPRPGGSATPRRQPSPQPSTSGLTPSGSQQRLR